MDPFRRILVPHDFSPHATRALALAADLARVHGGRLLVLHVITPFHPAAADSGDSAGSLVAEDLIRSERARLEAVVRATVAGKDAPRIECRVEIGDPFRRIADAAASVDSIVMATAGRTGLSHLVIGSVAEKVVRHASVPVLVVRPARDRATAPGSRRAGRRARPARAVRPR
jgi:nucleotide-binding universal stress UspA family protein